MNYAGNWYVPFLLPGTLEPVCHFQVLSSLPWSRRSHLPDSAGTRWQNIQQPWTPGVVWGETARLPLFANPHGEGVRKCWRGCYILSSVTREALMVMLKLRLESLKSEGVRHPGQMSRGSSECKGPKVGLSLVL